MARYTFRLPDIGEGIAEAEIVAWHVKPGERVEEDGRLADMMTDKATVEMESPVAGTVVELAGEVGEMVAIGSPLAVIETAGASRADERIDAENPDAEDVARAIGADKPDRVQDGAPGDSQAAEPAPPSKAESASPVAPAHSAERGKAPPARVLASPAVRHRAGELGIDLAQVHPTGDGRIRHADLDAFVAYSGSRGFARAGPTGPDRTVKVIGLRRRIADNMAAAKRRIPHFSYVEECDVTELETMRAQLNDARGDKPRLTLLPLLIAAICRNVPEHPMLNARYDDEAGVVTCHGAVDLGIATQTARGLMVPVIRGAQNLNLWQLAREIARLANAARDGTAGPGELSGSTLTVSSLGPLGGIASTPVINRPEVAIVAPNRIVERPMFVPDQLGGERVARRKLMNLSLSCDHRVVDGWDAARFVQAVKRLLETPVLLLAD